MSSGHGLLTPGVRWTLAGLGALLLLSLLLGFVVLPSVKPDFREAGWWQAICRAAGVPTRWYQAQPLVDPQASRIAVVPDFERVAGGDVGRGGTLALQCTMCHGARGVSASDIPNLAGQYAEVTFKQMMDYRGGHRRHPLMQALATTFSEQDIRDLSAFYAQLPRPSPNSQEAPAPALIAVGSPLRGIAPCASCHGGIDQKPGSAWLEGMPRAYLELQLQAFARGDRRNDAHGVMRNVARQMTAEEIAEVSGYYASRRVPFSASGR
ncbi:cytochrome c4 [Ramlibacter tataouinensis]|uniref:c-type cytochrome n=1 Tax=Ramlibacter tataouinensis TaxID=94132 RepID=UPI0022F37F55|nr:cytochrome c4 [Ramlibacter tataouinensis]WBY02449.1 cytochrome c4 [Ramlibacter tataouinensis]